MAKISLDEQEKVINEARKYIKYDTKEFTLEILISKFKRYIEDNKNTEIFIPFYQRKFVWNEEKQSKFIESIILGLPIPPMYFAEIDDGILEVIDGSQRIRTIERFLDNKLKLKKLKTLHQLNGLSFNDFSSSRKRKINNVSIKAIVITDLDKDTMSIRHEMFERLNTGGEVLKKMEVKKGAKEGAFIHFIYEQCSKSDIFNELSEFTKRDELRAYKEEFLVKYFAFSDNLNFDKSINEYLDEYIDIKNKEFEDDEIRDKYFIEFKKMLEFIKNNNLIPDLKINRKNKLLALYIGITLALRENKDISIKDKDIFTKKFVDNSKNNSFTALKENINLIKNFLLGI